jgi:GNAT superfamily N-acetyltransferase
MVTLDTLGRNEGARLTALAGRLDFSNDINYLVRCLESLPQERLVIVAAVDGHDNGLCVVNFIPSYPLFRRLDIPEIQDLNVHPDARGQGVGAVLVRAAEDAARAQGATQVGIGVGVTAAYGPAQRLYVKMGYVPDGAGVSVDNIPLRPGAIRAVDDAERLYMVKSLV